MLDFRILGPFEVVEEERPLVLGSPQQRALLAILLLRRGEAVSRDRLIDQLWGERAPPTAAKIVQGYVSHLRKALGSEVLLTRGGGYVLAAVPGQVDAERFEVRVADARHALASGNAASARDLFGSALALWRGEALADLAYEPFAQSEIGRLEEARLGALEDRIDADLALADHVALVGEVEALVRKHPVRERFLGQLMLALYRAGRQAEALDVYQHARVRLAEDLGLEPGPALKKLEMQILEQAPALQASPLSSRNAERFLSASGPAEGKGTPPRPPTPLIARERERATVCELLQGPSTRLVTLTGPGGVGKTRLAVEVARTLESSFRDGVCWVELAGVTRPDDVGSTIARALAVTPLKGESTSETLRRHLAGKRLLLAIDNFEHVLEAAELVADLHETCPGLALLVTSRELLNLAAEQRVIVAPLAVPAPGARTVGELEVVAGSALFLASARRRDSSFAVSSTTAPAIAEICARLDGLPLALELAAARTVVLSVQELAARVRDAVSDLGGGPRDAPDRQRTLDATIDWSYCMLDEQLQRTFVKFAVFADGATLQAARVIAGAELGIVEALVAKSLIERRRQPDGATRLVMLETIRQYALGRLNADPERQAAHRSHCEHYLRLVEQAVRRLSTQDEPAALALLDTEIENLRSALQWALQAAPEISLRLAGQLGQYWRRRADLEGLQWLDAALQAAGEHAPLTDRARARLHHADQLGFHHQGAAAIDGLCAAAALYRQANDHAGISETLSTLAVAVGVFADDLEGERHYAQEACRHARIAGDDKLLGTALGRLAAVSGDERCVILEQAAAILIPLGNYREVACAYSSAAYVALAEDRVAEATGLLDTALRAIRDVDDPLETTVILSNLGLARLFSGDPDHARDVFERGLGICAQHALREVADEILTGLAAVAAAQGRDEMAARLCGASHALGYPSDTFDQRIDGRLTRDYLADAQTRHGDGRWRAGERAGAELSRGQAIAYALGDLEKHHPTTHDPDHQTSHGGDTASAASPVQPSHEDQLSTGARSSRLDRP